MQPEIHIQPVEAWTYYTANRKRLEEEMVEIASNEATNTSVYITDENGFPYLYVYRDDKKIFQSECHTQYEAERNLRVVYAQYINSLHVVDTSEEEEVGRFSGNANESPEDEEDDDADTPPFDDLAAMTEEEWGTYCDEREDVIHDAVLSLIDILTEDETSALELSSEDDDSFNTVVDKIVEYLAIKCGFRIRRPMEIVDDDSGELVRSDYPYEDYDFGEGDLLA